MELRRSIPEMVFGISTLSFGNRKLRVEHLQLLYAAGYRHIELFANRPLLDYHNRGFCKEIAEWFVGNGMPPASLHLPFYEQTGQSNIRWISPLAAEERDRNIAIDELKRALELSDRMPLAYVVVHLGIPYQQFEPIVFDYAYVMIDAIRAFAGVEILIENIPNEISTVPRIMEFTEVAQLPEVGICYDSGHGHLQGAVPSLEGVTAIHVNDTNRQLDDHMWPFDGTIDWPGLIDELVASDYQGPMVFEIEDDDVARGWKHACRLEDLMIEAQSSLNDFREKYGLRRNHGDDLH